jgi:glycosyltransferase involved in cell wall biosynthesis
MFKRNHHVPLIFDAHETYPEQLSPEMRSELWHDFYTTFEKSLIGLSDGRMTVCDSLGGYFAQRYGAEGFVTVLNVPSVTHLPSPEILSRRRERRRILYHGSYFAYRGLEQIIRAARWIDEADIVLRAIGAHEGTLRELCRAEGAEGRITFVPPVPVADMVPAATDCAAEPGAIAAAINTLDKISIDRHQRASLLAARTLCWERESEMLVSAY